MSSLVVFDVDNSTGLVVHSLERMSSLNLGVASLLVSVLVEGSKVLKLLWFFLKVLNLWLFFEVLNLWLFSFFEVLNLWLFGFFEIFELWFFVFLKVLKSWWWCIGWSWELSGNNLGLSIVDIISILMSSLD